MACFGPKAHKRLCITGHFSDSYLHHFCLPLAAEIVKFKNILSVDLQNHK